MDHDEIALMINDCKKRVADLSEWEFEFIDTLSHFVKKGSQFKLNPKQISKLEDIWERVTA